MPQQNYAQGTVLVNPTNGQLYVVEDPNQFFSESWQPDTDAGRAASPWYMPGGGGYVAPPSGDTTEDMPTIGGGTTDTKTQPPPAGYSTVYWKDGSTQQVPTGDVEYWRSQSWSSAPPVAAPTGGPATTTAFSSIPT